MSEVAFLVMDLLHKGRDDLAFRFLNGYLEATGDYEGVGVLRFYLAYRAVVRAKIAAIRASQPAGRARMVRQEQASCRSYLELAIACLTQRRPALIIMHGLPGCGKTSIAQIGAEKLHAIRLRSDVERKRLFGLSPLESSGSRPGSHLYGAQATHRTYDRLCELSRLLLAAGFPVIVDAAFLRRAEREQFRALADALAVPFAIVSVQAGEDVLRSRIEMRATQGSDASEADHAVLEMLQVAQEPLAEDEFSRALGFANEGGLGEIACSPVWSKLNALLNGGEKEGREQQQMTP